MQSIQLSAGHSSVQTQSPDLQLSKKSPHELGKTNFVIHDMTPKTVHDLKNHEIVQNCEILGPELSSTHCSYLFIRSDLGYNSFFACIVFY